MPASNPAELYSAADIVGKTLYAKVQVPVYHSANDHTEPFGFVASGQPVGVVYSWLSVNPTYDRSTMWWMFADASGGYYYSKQIGGYYDVDALRAQGVITVTEKIEQEKQEEEEANMTTAELLIKRYGKYAALALLAAVAIKATIQKL